MLTLQIVHLYAAVLFLFYNKPTKNRKLAAATAIIMFLTDQQFSKVNCKIKLAQITS